MKHIRIIAVPPGEAPARIRSAWIGVTLPLADMPHPQPNVWSTVGVLSKNRGLLAKLKSLFRVQLIEQPTPSYVVSVVAAIESLRAQSPSAADWWERHTPHLIKPGQMFCFDASCCEEIVS
ncbi:hypothetical protein ACFONN_08340 [Dyella humi]|uniref:Uncharacterized protein n=1 Tax=Dyella humi TaxID=1770547 RepID=A0ABW8IIT2_9GAMM